MKPTKKDRIINAAMWLSTMFIGLFLFANTVCCVREYIRDKTTIIIKKDNNFAENRKVIFINNPSEFSCNVDFEQCKYNVPTQDLGDWNKLFGFTFLKIETKNPVHVDSARWGWRCINGRIEITPYCYVNGLIIKDKKIFEIKNKTDLAIKIRDLSYDFYIDGELVYSEKFTHKNKKAMVEWPYFGGNNKASNDIVISFFELKII